MRCRQRRPKSPRGVQSRTGKRTGDEDAERDREANAEAGDGLNVPFSSTAVEKTVSTRKNVVTASRAMPAQRGKSRASSGVPRATARQVSSGMTDFSKKAAAVAPASCAAQ